MSVGSDRAAAAVELAFREDWGRVVAALIRRTGDWDLAEDSAAEAFAAALPAWTRDGVPERPGAWLTTAAGNRALDRLRRSRRGAELLQRLGRDPLGPAGDAEEDPRMAGLFEDGEEIEDDRLRLIFTCCHPALALQARVALTLRTLAGLSTGEIARAFLVSEPTMAKRLTRAKARIAGAAIAEGLAVLDRSLGAGSVGPYGLQAAIAACHARAPTAQRTDWAQIAELYDRLLAVAPSPVVALNRAVAVAMTGDLRRWPGARRRAGRVRRARRLPPARGDARRPAPACR